jgi:hypothetical protein
MRPRIGSGKPLVGSKSPFGYRWSDSGKTHLVLDAETAPMARMVFEWALDGAPLRTIAARLAERGIPSPTGLPHWTPPVIRDLLLRPIYAGYQEAYTERIVRGGMARSGGTDAPPRNGSSFLMWLSPSSRPKRGQR